MHGGCKYTVSPGFKPLVEQLEKDEALPATGITDFRASSARSNYLAADCIDVQLATKEACHFISLTTATAAAALN